MYYDYLWGMLEPLGVYAREGYHQGELKALGVALDDAQEMLQQVLQELQPETAQGQGLVWAEEQFPMVPSQTLLERRNALEVLYGVNSQSCRKAELEKILNACGIPVVIQETEEQFHCLVSLQQDLLITDDPVFMMRVLELVMPCHMVIEVAFSYFDLGTGATVQERLDLTELRKRSQGEWESFLGSVEM